MKMNFEKFYRYLDGFKTYIENHSGESLHDLKTNVFFLNQEGYKHKVYLKANSILDYSKWNVSEIGKGKIADKVNQAVNVCSNLVFRQQKNHFKNRVNDDIEMAELILYNIYCSDNDAEAFDAAVNFFGGKYDLIAYLFFIKDDEKYLPISSSNFDERFSLFDIPFRTSRSCSSSNYFNFLECIGQLKTYMEEYYGFEISLLDAHSVIWQIGLANKIVAQMEEKNADAVLTLAVDDLFSKKVIKKKGYSLIPKEKVSSVCVNGHRVYPRDRFVSLNALNISNNMCEIELSHESFIRKNSDLKYMEPHHLVPLAYFEKFNVSLDVEENIICLCSNCHNEIHYGKRSKELVAKLYENRKYLLQSVGINISLEELISMY